MERVMASVSMITVVFCFGSYFIDKKISIAAGHMIDG
jgi:hypothetical protein